MEDECKEIIEVAEGPSICVHEGESEEHRPGSAVQEEAPYGIKVRVYRPYDETLSLVRRALDHEGLKVITEIDLRSAFLSSLGLDFPEYLILGVYDPEMAHKALDTDMDLGLLMPCNIIVYTHGGGTMVAALDPIAQLSVADGTRLREMSILLKRRLQALIDHVAVGNI